MAINIGGFLAKLVLETDLASFIQSKKRLDEVRENIKKTGEGFDKFVNSAVKGLLSITAAAVGAAAAVAGIQNHSAIAAKTAGIGAVAFNTWGNSFKLLGLNADSFTQSMGEMNQALRDYKIGSNSAAFIELNKHFSLIRDANDKAQNLSDYANLDPTQRALKMMAVLESTRGQKNHEAYLDEAERAGFTGIRQFEYALELQGKTGAQVFNEAQGLSVYNSSQSSNAVKNAATFNKGRVVLEDIGKEAADTIGTAMRPVLDDAIKYIIDHRKEISQFFKDLGDLLKGLLDAIWPVVKNLAGIVGDVVDKATGTLKIKSIQDKNPQVWKLMSDKIQALGPQDIFSKAADLALTNFGDPRYAGQGINLDKSLIAARLYEKGKKYTPDVSSKEMYKEFGLSPHASGQLFNVQFNMDVDEKAFRLALEEKRAHPNEKMEDIIAATMAYVTYQQSGLQ